MSFNMKESNGHKIFAMHENQTFKEFLASQQKEKTKEKQQEKPKTELIQGFDFKISSQKIKLSRDKDFIFASGIYKPVLKIFDLHQQSIKCERGLDCEIVDFEILSEDYRKVAIMLQDWMLEIQDHGGRFFQTKFPRVSWVIKFNPYTSEIFSAGSGNEIYRLDLNEGIFQEPFELQSSNINSLLVIAELNIMLAGAEDQKVDFVDLRTNKLFFSLDTESYSDITILQQGQKYNQFYTGTSEGLVQLFDLRSDKVLQQMQHPYMESIKQIQVISEQNKIITADSKQMRIHDSQDFTNQFLVFEMAEKMNDFFVFPDSGMIFTANETQNCGIYFVPSIGHAPKQFEYVESYTDQYLIESKENISDKHWFISYEELKMLNALELIGTNKLQSCLQGYKITHYLYNQLWQKNTHFDYEEYKKQQIQKELERKINQTIFNKDFKKQQKEEKSQQQKEGSKIDSRFQQKLEENEDFQIDELTQDKLNFQKSKRTKNSKRNP